MKRRKIIKTLFLAGGTMIYLPSCDWSASNISNAYDQLHVAEDEITFLRKLGEVIIPSSSDVPGSANLDLHDFVLVIVNDCLTNADQEKFMEGLRQFKSKVPLKESKREHDESAVSALQHIDEDHEPMIAYFTRTMKNLVIEGFMKSSFYMTDIMPYETAPGGFKGMVEIKDDEKINIYG